MTTCQVCATPLPSGSRFCYACGSQVPGLEAHHASPETPSRAEELVAKLRAALGEEYEIERELGRGGMGIVYLAREKSLDRHVALKILPPALAFDESLVERFIREARLAARLDHPHIVPIHRVGQTGDITYFAMKYVAGGSLQALLKNTPRPPLHETQRILAACARALGYAHAREIVHRDVKPANILLDTGGRVYMTDLGIAKAATADGPITQSGAIVGTPMYMAPEQCQGKPATALSDQYALAIVGYQMLAGKLPFDEKSMEGIMYDRLFGEPTPLETVAPDVPRIVRDAIHRALSLDPAARFPTMEEFAQAILGEAAARETTPAGHTVRYAQTPARTGASVPPAPPKPRRSRAALVAGALIVLAGAGAWWLWLRPAGEPAGTAANPAAQTEFVPPPTAPAAATWQLAGDIPAEARITIDGEAVADREGELEPGLHTVTVAAASYRPWSDKRDLAAGETWEIRPEMRPVDKPPASSGRRRAEPVERPGRTGAAEEARPPEPPPEIVLSAIRASLEDGRTLHNQGRYLEAADKYHRGLESVTQAGRTYRTGGSLAQLERALRGELARSIQACRQEGQTNCPTP